MVNSPHGRVERLAQGQTTPQSVVAPVEEVLAEQVLVDDMLVADVRANLTPADMVDRKLACLLEGSPLVVSRMRVGVPRIRG